MAKVNEDWRVLRHRPIDRIEPNMWCVTGTVPGMSLKRVMTLVRLAETPDLKRIVVSHHLPIIDEPAATLRRVAAGL